MIRFSTKAKILEALTEVLESGRVPESAIIEFSEWERNPARTVQTVLKRFADSVPLIVRSSSSTEDGSMHSEAGRYLTVANVNGEAELRLAIEQVFASYKPTTDKEHLFIQPMVRDVVCSGVAFSRDPSTGSDYFVINYEQNGSTQGVTSGTSRDAQTLVVFKSAAPPPEFVPLCKLLSELESLLAHDSLDIEFAIDKAGLVHLLQVRPLVLNQSPPLDREHLATHLREIQDKVRQALEPKPFLFGSRTVFGVMPDWNPAEIIGVRPRPLALSLYKELVTDSTWAYQRDNYGYRNLRSQPLIQNFHGCPYIDVRVDFNSFVPADVPEPLAEKLIEYYIDRLCEKPWLHDKVEFEILFSCYHFNLQNEIAQLRESGFTAAEVDQLVESLRRLTVNIIDKHSGLWKMDLERVAKLEHRHRTVMSSSMNAIEKIYWLLEDCKRYGTLPFAGLARAGFIAVQMLKSMVTSGLLDQTEYGEFMNSLSTVSTKMAQDYGSLSRETFLSIYGHLRPGTYDVLSARYDEAPDSYFDWNQTGGAVPTHSFRLSLEQYKKIAAELGRHGLDLDVLGLFEFLQSAIEGREHAKFLFTRSVSDALSLIKKLGRDHGFDAEEVSYLSIDCIQRLYSSSQNPREFMAQSIAQGKKAHAVTRSLLLPSLIFKPEDVTCFHMLECEPNYITHLSVESELVLLKSQSQPIEGKIVLIENADPGFDWIFTKGIKGFITMYGGVNSHMAIRAGEMKIPAVVGAGELNFSKWARAKRLRIDCCNRQVKVLQ